MDYRSCQRGKRETWKQRLNAVATNLREHFPKVSQFKVVDMFGLRRRGKKGCKSCDKSPDISCRHHPTTSLAFHLIWDFDLCHPPTLWEEKSKWRVEDKSIWSFESWNLNYQHGTAGKMSGSGRFHDFAAEKCHHRVLIITVNVSAAKYKVRGCSQIFLFSFFRKCTKKSFCSGERRNNWHLKEYFCGCLSHNKKALYHSMLLRGADVFVIYSTGPLFHFICRKCHSQMYKCCGFKQRRTHLF